MFWTYILYSESAGIFYKGHTNNLAARVKRHNAALENFTASGVPWLLVWSAEKESKAEAYQLEMKLKNLNRERLIRFMLKFEEGVGGSDELFLLKQLSEC